MLGENIGELSGKITGMRVLEGSKSEVSFQGSGKLLDVEVNTLVTYVAVARPDGTLFGDGQGVIMTKDGETVTFVGKGTGRPTGQGAAASWRGAIYCQTNSQKLARLNSIVVIFEQENDENGNASAKFWEWK